MLSVRQTEREGEKERKAKTRRLIQFKATFFVLHIYERLDQTVLFQTKEDRQVYATPMHADTWKHTLLVINGSEAQKHARLSYMYGNYFA